MSRVGIKPITVPSGVTVNVSGQSVSVKGPQGDLSWELPEGISMKVEDQSLQLSRELDTKQARALHGTARSLVANMIEGVSTGFKKQLTLTGIGYKSAIQGNNLTIQAGFSHPLVFEMTGSLKVDVDKDGTISVSGPDKQQVGAFAAAVRYSYPAEPYKGKGISYKDEQIRRKAGKTVA